MRERTLPKVMLGSPTSDYKDANLHINRKDYSVPCFFEYIYQLSYPNLEYYFVDNSKDEYYCRKMKAKGLPVDYCPPKGRTSREVLAESYEMIRKKFLDSEAEKLMVVECDIKPMPDVIERLIVHNKPVVGFPYFAVKDGKPHLLMQNRTPYSKVFTHARNMTERQQLRFIDGKVKPIFNIGIGCVLIDRKVMEQVPFYIDGTDWGFQDSFFAKDLLYRGIQMYVDTSAIVSHFFTGWQGISENIHRKDAKN